MDVIDRNGEDFNDDVDVVLVPGTGDYPPNMAETSSKRNKQAPSLHVRGSVEPIYESGIGLCGSRSVSEHGWELAKVVGEAVASGGRTLVSGYALGVDTAGHISAIESGGHTIAVLAEGLSQFRLKPEYPDPFLAGDRMTVISQFPADARWTVINAMTRNFTICALSSTLIAIEPGEKGGTLNAAQEAIRQSKPVYVLANPESRTLPTAVKRLLDKGATVIRTERQLRDVISEAVGVGLHEDNGSQLQLL